MSVRRFVVVDGLVSTASQSVVNLCLDKLIGKAETVTVLSTYGNDSQICGFRWGCSRRCDVDIVCEQDISEITREHWLGVVLLTGGATPSIPSFAKLENAQVKTLVVDDSPDAQDPLFDEEIEQCVAGLEYNWSQQVA